MDKPERYSANNLYFFDTGWIDPGMKKWQVSMKKHSSPGATLSSMRCISEKLKGKAKSR